VNDFKVLTDVSNIETIAVGNGIREIKRLRRQYGNGRWRKRKGVASVQLQDGSVRLAELQRCEAHGLGRHEFKIKGYLDQDALSALSCE
jgi:hypothetical protein